MMKKILTSVFVYAVVVLLLPGIVPAQDESESTEQPVEEEQASAETEDIDTSTDELRQGAYWWAEPEPASIAALMDFGVDTVAFRYGRVESFPDLSNAYETSDYNSTVPMISENPAVFSWAEGFEPPDLSVFPSGLEYRPVIEIGNIQGSAENFPAFLENEVVGPLIESGLNIRSVELRVITEFVFVWSQILTTLEELDGSELAWELGLNARNSADLAHENVIEQASMLDGIVVYFTDYGLYDSSPRITDRRWIDATCSQLEGIGVPYTVVLPIYNRALVYPQGEIVPTEILPALDLAMLADVSEIRNMGAAGTEYSIVQPIDAPDSPFGEGDRIVVLESLKDIDLGDLILDLPDTYPACVEMDLFRFPLVPGFDPTANEAIMAAGWIARPSSGDEIDPEAAERSELDAKYNKGSQIVWMIAMAMMFYLMIRMMRKGKDAKSGGGGGGESK